MHMTRKFRLFEFLAAGLLCAVCSAGTGAVFAEAGDGVDVYLIEAIIMAIPANGEQDVAVISDQSRLERTLEKDAGLTAVSGGISLCRIGSLNLTFDESGSLLWNGELNPPDDSGVELLTTPKIKVPEGQQATMMSGSRLQYFDKQDDGSFEIRVTPPELSPGLEFGCTVLDATEHEISDNEVILDFSLKLIVMEKREKIPGVDLDVGKPYINTRMVATRLLLLLDQWSLVSGHLVQNADVEPADFLLIFLKVNRLDPENPEVRAMTVGSP